MITIYFDEEGEAYAYEIPEYVTSISSDVWSIYSSSPKGVGWDIIDGVFTPLILPEELLYIEEIPRKESERYNLYLIAEDQISKCDNYILLGMETEKYTELRTQWLQYKMNVRKTQEQEGYPFEVTYPRRPDEDE